MFRLRLFGSPILEGDDVAIPARATQRHRLALLALLALAPGHRVSRDKLIALLWPDRDADGGRNLLKVSTYVLRSVLGEGALLSEGDDLRLNTALGDIDVAEFDAALERRDYRRAVALHTAPFLDGFFLSDAPEFESWSDHERQRLARGYRGALEALAEGADNDADFHAAIDWWKALAAHDPYDSRIALRLMQSLAASGNRAGALQHATVHERLLQAEFGVGRPQEIVDFVAHLKREPVGPVATSRIELPASSVMRLPDTPLPDTPPRRRPRVNRRTAVFVSILLLVTAAATLWRLRRADPVVTPESTSSPGIAVLPFENLGNADDEYFAAGMTDEITSRLGTVSGLGVVPSRATERYARTNKTMREIGRELGIDYVLGGSVRWAEAGPAPARRVRVTLELLRVHDERQLWSTTYDRVIDDIFDVQSDIAAQVIDRLGVTLAEGEQQRLRATPAANQEAYNLYLKGRHFWNKRTERNAQLALDYFGQAVALDPRYSLAWVGIADVWIFRGWYSQLEPRATFPKAKEAVLRALQYDSTLAEAHASLAHIHFEFDHDWDAAEREYRRAIELKPTYAIAHHWYGGYLSGMGRHVEALREAEMARTLDPVSLIIQTWVGLRYYFAGKPALAVREYEKALELDRGFAPAHWHLGWAYEQTGRVNEAVTAAQRALANDPENLLYTASLAQAYAKAGMQEEARAALARLKEASARRHVSAYHVALIHIALGETDLGLDWLERAYDEQSPWIGYLNVDPRLAPVRAHPRFSRIVRKAYGYANH